MKTSVNSYGVFLDTLDRATSAASRSGSASASGLSLEIVKILANTAIAQNVTSLSRASSIPILELVPKLQELGKAGLVEVLALDDQVRVTDLGRKVANLA